VSPWEATTAQIEDELRLGHPLLDPLNCFCCRVVAYSQRCRDLFRTSEIMFMSAGAKIDHRTPRERCVAAE
jgi:hypothetical protein